MKINVWGSYSCQFIDIQNAQRSVRANLGIWVQDFDHHMPSKKRLFITRFNAFKRSKLLLESNMSHHTALASHLLLLQRAKEKKKKKNRRTSINTIAQVCRFILGIKVAYGTLLSSYVSVSSHLLHIFLIIFIPNRRYWWWWIQQMQTFCLRNTQFFMIFFFFGWIDAKVSAIGVCQWPRCYYLCLKVRKNRVLCLLCAFSCSPAHTPTPRPPASRLCYCLSNKS